MADCEHLARTSAYFDGALAAADESAAAAHLASCAECQSLLGDAVGLDVALSGSRRAAAPRSKWPIVAVLVAAMAAAIALVLAWPRDPAKPRDAVAFELPAQRAIEARFTGPRFAPHRPRAAVRSDAQPNEAVSIAALAQLEQHGDVHDLFAALVASGDLVRAKDLATKLPDDAASASDRSALALASGDAETALAHAQHALSRDPGQVAARWNLGLAARQLHLDHLARAAFRVLAERHEPGWSDEAQMQVVALSRELAAEDGYPAFDARSQAMIAGGPVLGTQEVALYPAWTRIAFFDTARLAPDRPRLEALRPLAAELDRVSGTTHATAALDRMDPTATVKLAASYQVVREQTATPAEATRLITQLAALGAKADDLRLGAIIMAQQQATRLPELRAIAMRWGDPWFLHYVRREELRAAYPPGDPRGAPALRAALASCTGAAWAFRCGQLALDVSEVELAIGHDADAEVAARTAMALYRTAMAPKQLGRARALVAELHRLQGRTTLARAELENMVLAAGTRDCDGVRYARVTEAELAIVDGDWTAARAALPAATPPEGCTGAIDLVGVAAAVDLARATRSPADRAVAEAWLATSPTLADGGVAAIGALRIDRGAPAAVTSWIAAHVRATDQELAGVRGWGVTTLIDDAGSRAAWTEVMAAASAPPAACVVVASSDDDRVTIAIRTASTTSGQHSVVPVRAQATTSLIAQPLIDTLAGCREIAVVALPPLHGRRDLLPPQLPWFFVGEAPPRPPVQGRARSVEITDARPLDPTLPAIGLRPSSRPFDVRISGAGATPTNVLAALRDATYAQLDVHGVLTAKEPEAAYLALSPEPGGAYALRADAVAAAKLTAHPVIVLAACRAAAVAPYLRQRWSLPDAFITAGASAVIAVDVAIPDADAGPVFDELHRRIAAGEQVEAAVAAVRASSTAPWVQHLMVFR